MNVIKNQIINIILLLSEWIHKTFLCLAITPFIPFFLFLFITDWTSRKLEEAIIFFVQVLAVVVACAAAVFYQVPWLSLLIIVYPMKKTIAYDWSSLTFSRKIKERWFLTQINQDKKVINSMLSTFFVLTKESEHRIYHNSYSLLFFIRLKEIDINLTFSYSFKEKYWTNGLIELASISYSNQINGERNRYLDQLVKNIITEIFEKIEKIVEEKMEDQKREAGQKQDLAQKMDLISPYFGEKWFHTNDQFLLFNLRKLSVTQLEEIIKVIERIRSEP